MPSSKGTVIVTGGARRVGLGISQHLAACGYSIALHYNSSATTAARLKNDIEARGGRCSLFPLNLNNISGFDALMADIKQQLPDDKYFLVNNASIINKAGFMESDARLLSNQFALNFTAPIMLTQSFARAFQHGAVVNILDTDIVKTRDSYFMYLLSKKALAEFTRMAARSLAPHIRVNAVCPGTMLPDEYFGEDKMEELRLKLPLQKLPTVEATAKATQYLLENDYLTGQFIFNDGGQNL